VYGKITFWPIMKTYKIFGSKFVDGTFQEILNELSLGGLMVVPAAPALAMINENHQYSKALQDADISIFDSGFLCLLLFLFKGIRVRKLSGLEFLRKFLRSLKNTEENQIFLVEPTEKDADLNKKLFENHAIPIGSNQYIAPFYKENEISDAELLGIIEARRPKYIIINLGGGVQEVLGAYLKNNLDEAYRPAIICTGAAIAFLTGGQANIPKFVDYLYLGWFARCIADPRRFIPRYLSGFKLIKTLLMTKVEKC